jgi:exopolysaccharide biosynthesis polyprenyl glycosylphosphotransferase
MPPPITAPEQALTPPPGEPYSATGGPLVFAPASPAATGRRRTPTAVAVAVDLVAVMAAAAVAYLVDPVPGGFNLTIFLIVAAAWPLLFACRGDYRSRSVRISVDGFATAARDVVPSLILGGLILALAGPALWPDHSSGAIGLIAFLLVAALLVPLGRTALRSRELRAAGYAERALIVGSGAVAGMMQQKLRANPGYGIDLAGYVDDESAPGLLGCRRLGSREDLADVCERHGIDRVLLAYSSAGHEEMLALVRSIRGPDIQVSIVPRYFEVFPAHATLDDVEGIPVLTLPPVRLGRGARMTKRAFDLALVIPMLLVAAPLMAAIAIAIRRDSPGPALFRQSRRGRDGSILRIIKFRTMHCDAEQQRAAVAALNDVDGPLFKVRKGQDPRVTRIGHRLRTTSLDELPQLWNVLRGDMSLVGPRPFVLDEADRITGWASRRLDVTPGVTGLWQSMGRNDLSYDEMIKLDYLYVTNWSLWWDIRILARTARVVLRRSGAY